MKTRIRRLGISLIIVALVSFASLSCSAQPRSTSVTQKAGDGDGGAGTSTVTTEKPGRPGKPRQAAPHRTVSEQTAFILSPKSANQCTAMAPEDWAILAGQASDTADMLSADRTMYAGWGIKPVNTTLAGAAHLYPAPMNDPELYSTDPQTTVKAYANVVIHSGSLAENDSSGFRYTNDYQEEIGAYSLRSIESDRYKGVILFHSEGFPGDGQYISYIEPMHIAITQKDLWEKKGMLVAKIAVSIRCTTQPTPPADSGVDPDLGGGGGSDGGPGGGDGEGGDEGEDEGYNPQLGTEYVHDEGTGENYLVSPSDNWSSDGPEGPGYYKQNGNDYTKLDPGRSD